MPAVRRAQEESIFVPGTRMDRKDLRALSLKGVCGFRLTPSGNSGPVFASIQPLTLIEAVEFFEVSNSSEVSGSVQISAFKSSSHGVIVPIAGGLVSGSGRLDDEKLASLGIRRVVDPSGGSVTWPMFAHGGRSLLQPCRFDVPIVVIDGVPTIALSREAIVKALEDLFGEKAKRQIETIRIRAEKSVREEYARSRTSEPYGKFRVRESEAAFRRTALKYLEKLSSGAMKRRITVLGVPCCALQYKGTGCGSYKRHYIPKEPARIPQTEAGQSNYRTDDRFVGMPGIFLPFTYQRSSSEPVGGQCSLEEIAYERQQRILEKAFEGEWLNGATEEEMLKRVHVLSGFITGLVRLADRDALPELSSRDICESIVATQRDTRRIGMFVKRFRMRSRWLSEAYELFVLERMGAASRTMDTFLNGRDAHLSDFFSNLSLTTRAVLAAGLTNPRNQNLMNNIDVEGGIADLADLADMKDPHDAIGLFQAVIEGLEKFGNTARFGSLEIFKTAYFRNFVREVAGAHAEKVFELLDSPRFNPVTGWGGSSHHAAQLQKLASLLTDAWAEEAGAPPAGPFSIDDDEFAEKFFPEALKLRLSEIIDEGELDILRARVEDRLSRVPSIEENSAILKRKIWGEGRQS